MTNKSEVTVNERSLLADAFSWLAGILFLVIGLINTFWGNDAGYGIFIVLLSLLYFPPANAFLKRVTNFSIPFIAKVLLAIFILWTALGVAELFDKINLMLKDF